MANAVIVGPWAAMLGADVICIDRPPHNGNFVPPKIRCHPEGAAVGLARHADRRRRAPRLGERVVRLEDGESGLSARTIARRLSSLSGLFAYLLARGDAGVVRNPVPRGLPSRQPGRRGRGGVPLVRTPPTLPRVLGPDEVDAMLTALRTRRDTAMVQAMLLGGLRLGLRLGDVNAGERRLFIADGKGGRQRIVPVSSRFFAALGDYLRGCLRTRDRGRVSC